MSSEALIDAQHESLDPMTATDKYNAVMEWLSVRGLSDAVPPAIVEQYAICTARWEQAERAVSHYGMIAKGLHGAAPSPFIAIAASYRKQSAAAWKDIVDAVKISQKYTPHVEAAGDVIDYAAELEKLKATL